MPSIKTKLKTLIEDIKESFRDDQVIVETYHDKETGITIVFETSKYQRK
jgi:hypothetical protein